MVKRLRSIVLGSLSFVLIFLLTCFWFVPVFGLWLWRTCGGSNTTQFYRIWQARILYGWIAGLRQIIHLLPIQLKISEDIPQSDPIQWALVLANHRSWTDILILLFVLGKKLPPYRFFLKDSLKYLPLVGMGCQVLDMIFVKRRKIGAPGQQIQPVLKQERQKLLEACVNATQIPSTIVIFPEGTRLTAKHYLLQKPPYRYLLQPKAGGIQMILQSLKINGGLTQPLLTLDVTIMYPPKPLSLWLFFSGEVTPISVQIRTIESPPSDDRAELEDWLNQLWTEKDKLYSNTRDDRS